MSQRKTATILNMKTASAMKRRICSLLQSHKVILVWLCCADGTQFHATGLHFIKNATYNFRQKFTLCFPKCFYFCRWFTALGTWRSSSTRWTWPRSTDVTRTWGWWLWDTPCHRPPSPKSRCSTICSCSAPPSISNSSSLTPGKPNFKHLFLTPRPNMLDRDFHTSYLPGFLRSLFFLFFWLFSGNIRSDKSAEHFSKTIYFSSLRSEFSHWCTDVWNWSQRKSGCGMNSKNLHASIEYWRHSILLQICTELLWKISHVKHGLPMHIGKLGSDQCRELEKYLLGKNVT